MAVVAHVVLPGLTKDDYNRVREAVGPSWVSRAN
jgi:hypothetical protein